MADRHALIRPSAASSKPFSCQDTECWKSEAKTQPLQHPYLSPHNGQDTCISGCRQGKADGSPVSSPSARTCQDTCRTTCGVRSLDSPFRLEHQGPQPNTAPPLTLGLNLPSALKVLKPCRTLSAKPCKPNTHQHPSIP